MRTNAPHSSKKNFLKCSEDRALIFGMPQFRGKLELSLPEHGDAQEQSSHRDF